MNLPQILTDLIAAQNSFDSVAYAHCFSKTAVVFDEGKRHVGKAAIQNWIAKANETYRTMMKPLAYSETKQTLDAEISGNFPGSPLILTYQFELKDSKIQLLKIV
ncbi:nuclear transport factor 2 family protein [Confluentibacter sediminis]|uniref:nuclear transport factor 2 family protein n=1 Tax=Confluentibacter sediminis TaxID=2219045 RepID=UPI000DADA26D|nr:nuclear transport factor 2 family protein [Confluentibacter sediminis]